LPDFLVGELERIVYINEENGYTVARLKVKGRKSLPPLLAISVLIQGKPCGSRANGLITPIWQAVQDF